MAQELPKDFVDFETALRRSAQETSNVIGRVTDFLPPRPSRGTDWQSKLELAEFDTFGSQAVKWFRPNPSDHPQVTGTGDIVVLWNMKSSEWSGMKFLLSNHGSTWLVFHQKDIPEKADSTQLQLKYVKEKRAQKPTPEIMRYACALCNAGPRDVYTEPLTQLPTPDGTSGTMNVSTGPRDKFSLIKDVKADTFYHIVAQVVKVFPTQSCLEIFVTDYTSNSLLFNHEKGSKGKAGVVRDGDEYGYAGRMAKKGDFSWPGPLGTRTLTVTLWPPHSYWASTNVKVNDTVFLRNTRIKVSTLGTLEGVMHSDKKYEDRIDISVIRIDKDADQRVKDLFRRKKDYEKQMKEEMNGSGEEVNGLKRQRDDSSEPLSKAQKKKKRKQEQMEKAKLGANGGPQEKDVAKSEANDKPQVEEPISGVAAIRAAKNELNRNSAYRIPISMLTRLTTPLFS
jgi:protection-of-telomeres protein 1